MPAPSPGSLAGNPPRRWGAPGEDQAGRDRARQAPSRGDRRCASTSTPDVHWTCSGRPARPVERVRAERALPGRWRHRARTSHVFPRIRQKDRHVQARPAPAPTSSEIATRLADQTELWQPLVRLRPRLPLLRPAGLRARLRGLAAHLGARARAPTGTITAAAPEPSSCCPATLTERARRGQPVRAARIEPTAPGPDRPARCGPSAPAHAPGHQPRARAGGQPARLLPRAGGDEHLRSATATSFG